MDFWMTLIEQALLPVVVAVLTPVLLALARRGIRELERRTDIQLSERREKQILNVVDDAIHFAEEQARKALKGKETDFEKITDSEMKMKAAIKYVRKRADEMGLDELVEKSSDELAELIESRLFRKRLENGGSGADAKLSALGLPGEIKSPLSEAGLDSVEDVKSHGLDRLTEIDDIGEKRAARIRGALESGGFV